MPVKLTLPDTVKPFLKGTEQKGVFASKNDAAWLKRRLIKTGKLALVSADEGKYYSSIINAEETKHGTSLLIAELSPTPPDDFFEAPQPVKARINFVEAGFEFVNSFHAVLTRQVQTGSSTAAELADVRNLRIGLGLYSAMVSKGELSMLLRGEYTDFKIARISLRQLALEGSLPQDVGPEGITVDKALIRLGSEWPEMTVGVKLAPTKTGQVTGMIEHHSEDTVQKLGNFIEQRWSGVAQAASSGAAARSSGKRQAEWVGGGGGSGGEAGQASDPARVDDIYKPHFFLLSDDEAWGPELRKYSVIHQLKETDAEKVLEELDEKRCDMILADADTWQDAALELMMHLRSHKKHQRIPVFWFAGEDNIFAEAGGQDLVDLGAYDYLPRDMEHEQLRERLRWARKQETLGEGPALVTISPDPRMQYRLGIALRREDFSIVKELSTTNFIGTLNERDARWVLVDAVSIGEGYEKILSTCLNWAAKGSDPSHVFLMSTVIGPEEAEEWLDKGVAAFIIYDPAMEKVRETVHGYMDASGEGSGPEQEKGPKPQ